MHLVRPWSCYVCVASSSFRCNTTCSLSSLSKGGAACVLNAPNALSHWLSMSSVI